MKRIISLTSIPPRFPLLQPTLQSVVDQGADEVRLYIPPSYSRFPEWDGTLPEVPKGVTIHKADRDYGPATKILPACRDLRGKDVQILFCDDDGRFAPDWAKTLFHVQAKRPKQAVAAYVRSSYLPSNRPPKGLQAKQLPIRYAAFFRMSQLLHRLVGVPFAWRRPFVIPGYGDVLFGVGGAVVRPEFFDDMAYNIPAIAWPVDDIWLSANLAKNRIRIYCPWMVAHPQPSSSNHTAALVDTEFQGKGRQQLNRAASEHCQQVFGVWL